MLEDVSHHLRAGFQRPGCGVFLLGAGVEQAASTLAGSEYLEAEHGRVAGLPRIDLQAEARLQRLVLRLHAEGLLASAHDTAEGGLAVTLAESALIGGCGFRGETEVPGRLDAALFGEAPSRIVVSVLPDEVRAGGADRVWELAREGEVEAAWLGRTLGEPRLSFGPIDAGLADLRASWESLIEGNAG
jgi:phosphoribosylformylglycinamidine synthase